MCLCACVLVCLCAYVVVWVRGCVGMRTCGLWVSGCVDGVDGVDGVVGFSAILS